MPHSFKTLQVVKEPSNDFYGKRVALCEVLEKPATTHNLSMNLEYSDRDIGKLTRSPKNLKPLISLKKLS